MITRICIALAGVAVVCGVLLVGCEWGAARRTADARDELAALARLEERLVEYHRANGRYPQDPAFYIDAVPELCLARVTPGYIEFYGRQERGYYRVNIAGDCITIELR